MTRKESMCRVSVCMATYNGEKFLKEQLSSIITQLDIFDEIIISDDSSTDETLNIINDFQDKRIRLFENQSFQSAVLNFENALKHSTGRYIFLSDQDDVWKPGKVDLMIKELQQADLVISDCDFINENGKIIGDSYFKLYKSEQGVLKNFVKNTYLGNCIAFNRKVLECILPFPPQLIKTSKFLLYHDVWIGLVANLCFTVKFMPVILSSYRRHSNNASPTDISTRSPNPLSNKLKSRWLLATALVSRIISRF